MSKVCIGEKLAADQHVRNIVANCLDDVKSCWENHHEPHLAICFDATGKDTGAIDAINRILADIKKARC